MGFDMLGGFYLAYDLLGGKRGPLRSIARCACYIALFVFGYFVVLGLRYAAIAGAGMGVLLAIEFGHFGRVPGQPVNRTRSFVFGALRGVVIGLAAITLAGPAFGAVFGTLSGIGLILSYAVGFAPADDYESKLRPRIGRHRLMASATRALVVSVSGVAVSLLLGSYKHTALFGLRLGLAAGTVSALVGLFSPMIEWWIDQVPPRTLGALGLGLIFIGMLAQSAQYWVVIFDVGVR
jgi:hypothetical protein